MKNKLMQLFRANAQCGTPLRTVRNANDDTRASLYVYDAIGGFWGISAEDIARGLDALGDVSTIDLRVNSPGGDVFEARAMATLIKQHPANVATHIDGLAASAGTQVANAGDTIEIAQGGFYMIHNAWSVSIGNRHDMLDMAGTLEQIDNTLVAEYARRTGESRDQVTEWMDAETWFSADDAMAHGFVDSVFGDADDDTEADTSNFDLSVYQNAPRIEPKIRNDQLTRNMRRLRMAEQFSR